MVVKQILNFVEKSKQKYVLIPFIFARAESVAGLAASAAGALGWNSFDVSASIQ